MKKNILIIILIIAIALLLWFVLPKIIHKDLIHSCYKEGKTFNIMKNWDPNAKCCQGLKKMIVDTYPSVVVGKAPDCPTIGHEYICSKCGDGVCNNKENWCNCPEDCKKPEMIPCTKDSDCGQDRCDNDPFNCSELKYICKNGECFQTVNQYKGYSCAAQYDSTLKYPENTKCLDKCGDGECKSPENRHLCPQDCK